ncbi:peptidylprolyl isomerase [Marinobacter zhejiangensis]|uniref:peptidylprolyl isomerase n=1 Tax=Marinobacter zhejiangensis TaxID=488535 RepID=A0A1I4SXH1_9GAMM|nr:peptidylprolyl isomerase [Marinobacter zhejiangensis]SFM69121.1 peptidyl-prolyl cis-trans isomerase C [Marinobacter zhejiangensis]
MQLIPTGDADKPRNQFPPVYVGDQLIDETDIASELQHHPAGELSAAWHEAAVSLVIRELLLRRAGELELAVTDDNEEAVIAAVLERELDVPEPAEADCLRYYEANREKFYSPTILAASHILLAAAPDDIDERLQQEDLAREMLRQLREEGASFETLARRHSACESREHGGSLGQLVRGQTVREFEERVWAAPEGLVADPVESRYGWHIVRVDQRLEGEPLPFDAAKSMVRHQLLESVSRRALRQYVQALAMDIGVSGVDLDLPDSPLMQ